MLIFGYSFVHDANTHAIHDQFMWGEAFLISPVLDEGNTTVDCYFPEARWYSYHDVRLPVKDRICWEAVRVIFVFFCFCYS